MNFCNLFKHFLDDNLIILGFFFQRLAQIFIKIHQNCKADVFFFFFVSPETFNRFHFYLEFPEGKWIFCELKTTFAQEWHLLDTEDTDMPSQHFLCSPADRKSGKTEASGGWAAAAGGPVRVHREWLCLYEEEGGGDAGHKRWEGKRFKLEYIEANIWMSFCLLSAESTNTRVLYFSIFSMCCLIGLATWQVFYLRRFFKAKKLIE